MRLDRKGQRASRMMARAAESNYASRLLQVAKQIDHLVRGFQDDPLKSSDLIQRTLRGYADLLGPWAESVARYMLAEVGRRNLQGWLEHSSDMSRSLRAELEQAPTGSVYAALMDEQVQLIKSMPLDAAERIQHFAREAMVSGKRADYVAAEILRSGQVSAGKARLIARTEVSRSASTLIRARAEYVGSEGYIWRTSNDGDVRPTHRAVNGRYVPWDDPPKTDKGLAPYHAGCGPNCRCWPDPVLPD